MFEHRREEELRVWAYLLSPSALNSMDTLTHYGRDADRAIAACNAMIEKLNAYKMQLYERAQEIASAPWHTELLLKRERGYDTISYFLQLKKVYDAPGIEPETLESTKYPGRERCAAIKAYREYCKSHPGITARMDISRAAWEK